MERNRAALRLGIHHQFVNKNSNHDDSQNPDLKISDSGAIYDRQFHPPTIGYL
jgi:hypothetical protein